MKLLLKTRTAKNRGHTIRREPTVRCTATKGKPSAEALSGESDARRRCREAKLNLAIGFSKILVELGVGRGQ